MRGGEREADWFLYKKEGRTVNDAEDPFGQNVMEDRSRWASSAERLPVATAMINRDARKESAGERAPRSPLEQRETIASSKLHEGIILGRGGLNK